MSGPVDGHDDFAQTEVVEVFPVPAPPGLSAARRRCRIFSAVVGASTSAANSWTKLQRNSTNESWLLGRGK